MKLFIGGSMQDKLNIVCDYLGIDKEDIHIYDGNDMTIEDFKKADIVNHFHLFVKRFSKEFMTEDDRKAFIRMLECNNPKIMIIGDEIGCGIVPFEEADRAYRENYGRVMCALSQNSQKVVRIICGICREIKK